MITSINEFKSNTTKMIEGIIDLLKQVKDIDNRRSMAENQIKNLKSEGIDIDSTKFMKDCGC